MAESENGIDNFRFWDKPVVLPQIGEPDTNVYDMRLTAHEDGWLYGIFVLKEKIKAIQILALRWQMQVLPELKIL